MASLAKKKKTGDRNKPKAQKPKRVVKTYVDGILEDYGDGGQSDEEDGDEEDEDEERGPINYDGGDGEKSDDEDPAAATIIDLTDDSWSNFILVQLGFRASFRGQAPVQEDIKDVLPKFKGRHSGCQVNRTAGQTLIESAKQFFLLLFSAIILNQFIYATNSWGRRNTRGNRWKDVDTTEFLTFLAIILHLGVVKYPRRGMPWMKTGKYSSPWIRSMMYEHRFEQLLRAWHWTDTSELSQKEREDRNKDNCFWSVQGFLDTLSDNFLEWYNPYWKCNIDEGVFGFKGRHRARCYNPAKPDKWHFKSFCLNCSMTGYLMCFFMYMGKDEKRPPGVSATEYPVTRLTDHPKFKNINLILATDNWYTSIFLVLKMLAIGIYLFGTCRVNKQGIPKGKVFSKTGANKKNRGEASCEKAEVKVGDSKYWVYFLSWMDNKPVHFISTFMSKMSVVERVVKVGKKYMGKAMIQIPTLAMIYNQCMGGTDQFDQLLSYYKTTVRTKRWQTRIFTHFLTCAVVNASILYRLYHKLDRTDKGYNLLDFIEMLVDQLATPRVDQKVAEEGYDMRYVGVHTPVLCKREVVENTEISKRSKCSVCKKRINQFCKQCGMIPLCFASFEGENSCWEQYHTETH